MLSAGISSYGCKREVSSLLSAFQTFQVHPKFYIRTAKSMNQFQRHNQLIVKEKFAPYAPVSLKRPPGGVGFITNLIHSNESEIACKFADIIYFSFLKPLMTKPSRVPSNTLVHNILTNDFDNYATYCC